MDTDIKNLPEGSFDFARESDFEALVSLWQQAFGDDRNYIVSWLARFFTPVRVPVYRVGEGLAAMASVFRVNCCGKPALYIYALATGEKYRGRGIASALLNNIQQQYSLPLVLQPEPNGVDAFYLREGFVPLSAEDLFICCTGSGITEMTLGFAPGFSRGL